MGVLLSCTGFVMGFVRVYWVQLGLTGFDWVFPELYWTCHGFC